MSGVWLIQSAGLYHSTLFFTRAGKRMALRKANYFNVRKTIDAFGFISCEIKDNHQGARRFN